MSAPEELLKRSFRDLAGEEELSRVWASVEDARPRRPRPLAVASLAAVLAAAAVGVMLLVSGESSSTLVRRDGTPLGTIGSGERCELADGSAIATDADGRVEVLQNRGSVLALHLRAGSARFEVTPRSGRQWRIEARGVSVEVAGTVFTVARATRTVDVAVERGAVIVRGPGVPDGVRRLAAGDAISIGDPAQTSDREEHSAEESRASGAEVETTAEEALLREASTTRDERTSPEEVEAPLAPVSEPARLMRGADEARRAGRIDDAIDRFVRVVHDFPASAEAPLAAFTAARLCDRRGEPVRARELYRFALDRGLPPDLAEAAERAVGDR